MFAAVAAAALPRTHLPRPCCSLLSRCSSAASPAALTDALLVARNALVFIRVLLLVRCGRLSINAHANIMAFSLQSLDFYALDGIDHHHHKQSYYYAAPCGPLRAFLRTLWVVLVVVGGRPFFFSLSAALRRCLSFLSSRRPSYVLLQFYTSTLLPSMICAIGLR